MLRKLARRLGPLLLVLAALGAAAPAHAIVPNRGIVDLVIIPQLARNCPEGFCPSARDAAPAHTAAEFRDQLAPVLREYGLAQSRGRFAFNPIVVANPDRPDGWWVSPDPLAEWLRNGSIFWDDPDGTGIAPAHSAARLYGEARRRGLIAAPTRPVALLVLDTLVGGGGVAHPWPPTYTLGLRPDTPFQFAGVAFASQSAIGTQRAGLVPHEAIHLLGPVDYYGGSGFGTECPPEPGGRAGTGDDCVDNWDLMAVETNYYGSGAADRTVSLSAFTRRWLDWLDPSEVLVLGSTRFSGRVTLDLLGNPSGPLPKVLYRPSSGGTPPPGSDGTYRLTDDSDPMRGVQVECRRRQPGVDFTHIPGALVTWADEGVGGVRQLRVVRFADRHVNQMALQPGETYRSPTLGFEVTLESFDADGRCVLVVNGADGPRIDVMVPPPAPPTSPPPSPPAGTRPSPSGTTTLPTSTPPSAFSSGTFGTGSTSSGVPVLRGTLRPRLTLAVRNVGTGRSPAGRASIRLHQPLTAFEGCGGRLPGGRALSSIVPALDPGEAGIVRFPTTRLKPGSVGIRAQVSVTGDQLVGNDGATGGWLLARRPARGRPLTVSIDARVDRRCRTGRSFFVAPQVLPRGWRIDRTRPVDLRPGERRTIRLRVRPPRTARGVTSLPLLALAGPIRRPRGSGARAAQAASTDEEHVAFRPVAALDVAVAPPGVPLVMPAPAVPPPVPTLPGLVTGTVTAECTSSTEARGAVTPARAGVPVALELTAADGRRERRTALTTADGHYAAALPDGAVGQRLIAATATDLGATGAVSAPCFVPSTRSTISLTCPAEAFVQSPAAVTGAISPGRAGAVRVVFTGPGGAEKRIDVSSGQDGGYAGQVLLDQPGTWTGQATWDGDSVTVGANSAPCTVSVS